MLELKINLNKFCQEIAKEEGGKENLSIAQVKQVVRLTLLKIAAMTGISIKGISKK